MRSGSRLLLQSALDHYRDGNTAENTLRKVHYTYTHHFTVDIGAAGDTRLSLYHCTAVYIHVIGLFPSQSYKCDVSLLPPELSRCFVRLQPDDVETRDFLERSKRIASNVCLQLFYSFVQFLLCMFMSQTAING